MRFQLIIASVRAYADQCEIFHLLTSLFFQIFRLHNVMFGVVVLVVSVVCLAMTVLITAHEDADNDD